MLADRLRMASNANSVPSGQQLYTAGSYSFVVPAGVTSISVCAIGAGGIAGYPGTATNRGGGGGGLSYVNSISVTPGETLTVVAATAPNTGNSRGADSEIKRSATVLCSASSGYAGDHSTNPGLGGGVVVGTGGDGGTGGLAGYGATTSGGFSRYAGGGGGGAAGYSGNGGNGANAPSNTTNVAGSSGAGGGAAGGAAAGYTYVIGADTYYSVQGYAGGGTGILGTGSSGTGDSGSGDGGSGGNSGAAGRPSAGMSGGAYGGGGGSYQENKGATPWNTGAGLGGTGAVRIIWGTGRSYPSNAA